MKINIFLSSQPTQQHSSYKQKQSAEGAVFDGGAFGCLQTESAYNKKTQGFKSLRLLLGWKMGLEPTTLGTTILYSNQLSYIHHLDLITQIGCKYRVFIVSLQIYLQKFSENNRYPIYNYSQTTADGALPSHRSPSPALQPYSHCPPAHLPPACCDHHPCNIPR